MSIQPFQIAVPDEDLDRLKQKLSAATFPQEVDFAEDWDYGAPRKDIQRLAAYWQHGFDWRAAEAKLNHDLPQFTTTVAVDGFGDLPIHFVHKRADKDHSIPLLFCHGWPGSFLEVVKILPLLTASSPDGPSFHVVAPSLPNFGFSAQVSKPGFAPLQHAEVCHKLMRQLGYDRYVTQGGDWGYIITRLMGVRYPAHVLASHFNFVRLHDKPTAASSEAPAHLLAALDEPLTAQETQGLERSAWFKNKGYGYNMEQSTRPHTLGFALADSPVALLAWIYEKLHDWTDSYPWTDDEVLTWISIYAFSTAGADASVRIYYESTTQMARHAASRDVYKYLAEVPLGMSMFPYDLVLPPSSWARTLGPVVFLKRHEDGGHFAAYERPDQLVQDLRVMFGKGGGAETAVAKL